MRLSEQQFDALLQRKPANPKAAMQALGRLPKGRMNKTETLYAQHLEARKHAGEIQGYWFEGMKFRLADATFYTPDFMVLLANGELQAHEIKGFWTDDARVKIKVAAATHPVAFVAIQRKSGDWVYEWF